MSSCGIDVSITIATCSRSRMLQRTLNSLLPQAQAVPFRTEFVIVDDRSSDDTAEVLKHFQQTAGIPVAVVQGNGTGIAAARNLLFEHSRGTWLACCDDDQIAAPDWLFSLYETALTTSSDVVGGSMHLHLPAGYSLDDYGPRARRLLGEAGLERKEGPFSPGHHPATNNVLIRAEAVRKLGGFNPDLVEGGEDRDLFSRARSAGYVLWFTPRARMQHMLTERRVTRQGLRWTAMRIGSGDTRTIHLRRPYVGPLRHAATRLAVLFLRDLPQLAFAALIGRRVAVLDVKCSLWYSRGVLRTIPALLHPRARRSRAFLQEMNFRLRDGERPAQL